MKNNTWHTMKLMIEELAPVVLPKKKGSVGGTGSTPTFNPSNKVLTPPQYREHIEDIFDTRLDETQNAILVKLFTQDPDVSAAVGAYLTLANTTPRFWVYNADGEIDPDGIALVKGIVQQIFTVRDYSLGYQHKETLQACLASMRYMMLLRGSICNELVLDKAQLPYQIRHIDVASLQWQEPQNGNYKPFQTPPGGGDPISLDFSTIFLSYHHQNPKDLYSYSVFSACINTISARQHVINTLYSIMRHTGFDRMSVEVLEEVLLKTAPQSVKDNPKERTTYINTLLTTISGQVANLRADQPFVHTDAVKPQMIGNGGKGGAGIQIQQVIETLNDQNQAALKSMGTILGRGDSGVNTSSTEARMFSLNTDELNIPIAGQLSRILTLAVRLQGFDGWVEVEFDKAELRPATELEPQLSIKQTRLQKDLSLGLISDQEYHMMMYGELAHEGAPELSGTGFLEKQEETPAGSEPSPNADPLGRSVTPEGSKSAKDSRNK